MSLQTLPTPRRSEPRHAEPRPGPLGRLADVTFRHRGRTVLAWLALLGVAVGLSMAFGGDFKADYSAPGSDSSQAQQLLEDRFPAQAGDTVDVVVRADGGVTQAGTKADVRALLDKLGRMPHVAAVEDPYSTAGA